MFCAAIAILAAPIQLPESQTNEKIVPYGGLHSGAFGVAAAAGLLVLRLLAPGASATTAAAAPCAHASSPLLPSQRCSSGPFADAAGPCARNDFQLEKIAIESVASTISWR